jgi:hypothetical protein
MHDQPGSPSSTSPADHRPELLAVRESGRRGEHGVARSGRQLGTVLAPTGGQDRPASAGPHPQAESMGLRAATVVGLEGALALAHGRSPGFSLHNRSRCCLPATSTEQAKCTPKAPGANGRHVEGTHPGRPHQIGGTGAGRSARRPTGRDTGPEGGLWQAVPLVSVPLLLWRGGSWLRPSEVAGAETLNPRGVRW